MPRGSSPIVDERRAYEIPETVRVTLCPLDHRPVPRTQACWSFCGKNCWVEFRDGKPVERARK